MPGGEQLLFHLHKVLQRQAGSVPLKKKKKKQTLNYENITTRASWQMPTRLKSRTIEYSEVTPFPRNTHGRRNVDVNRSSRSVYGHIILTQQVGSILVFEAFRSKNLSQVRAENTLTRILWVLLMFLWLQALEVQKPRSPVCGTF